MHIMMKLPPFYNLFRIVAQIGAALGCIMGVINILVGLAAFKFGLIAGITALSGGMYLILASLAGLGVSYGFLAIVKAQIDSRNALIFCNQKYDSSLLNIANNESPKEINNKTHSEDIAPIDKVTNEVVALLRKRDRKITISNNKYVVSPIIEQTSLSKFLFSNKTSYYDNIEDVINIYSGAGLNS